VPGWIGHRGGLGQRAEIVMTDYALTPSARSAARQGGLRRGDGAGGASRSSRNPDIATWLVARPAQSGF
jgi:hypothetical protein